jgi:porphobilinogen synthase
MAFPRQRLRRLRQNECLRRLVRETTLSVSDFIYPMFVTTGRDRREEISSMPGQYRWSVDLLVKEVTDIKMLGIPAVILFGDPRDQRSCAGPPRHDGCVHRRIYVAWTLWCCEGRTHRER